MKVTRSHYQNQVLQYTQPHNHTQLTMSEHRKLALMNTLIQVTHFLLLYLSCTLSLHLVLSSIPSCSPIPSLPVIFQSDFHAA